MNDNIDSHSLRDVNERFHFSFEPIVLLLRYYQLSGKDVKREICIEAGCLKAVIAIGKCCFSLPLSLGVALISSTSRLILEGALHFYSVRLIILPVFVFMCFRQASDRSTGTDLPREPGE